MSSMMIRAAFFSVFVIHSFALQFSRDEVDVRYPLHARADGASTRLAFLKTGRCASSILMQSVIEAACSNKTGETFHECYMNNWAQEVLFPGDHLNMSKEDIQAAVKKELVPKSTCAGEGAACGWSICASCLRTKFVPILHETEYWKAIAKVIVDNDMQVLFMTRANAVEWGVSQALAFARNELLESKEEFKLIRGRAAANFDKPCSGFTLDGCSEEQKRWIEQHKVDVDMKKVQFYVDLHRAVDTSFGKLKDSLLAMNQDQRIMWITMEEMTDPEVWKNMYEFVGQHGAIPEVHPQHGRYTNIINNYAELQEYARSLDTTFD
eukprot:TRINITY_DN54317_c0_g1_i1.p1 TRINITY_DN54317_c0_g1~~TRINITY_DN54317_c0_g1_i1.p1  ORF type:complete len:340 (-),score=52.44 TRINITY_DN54317_c0_g1_i1:51-1019(-)